MSRLSTKHVVLGLLIERPGYGWDLQQRLDSRLGFLGLSASAIYKLLERLEAEGLIREDGPKKAGGTRRGAPRIMYCATEQGREHFETWLLTPSHRAVLRDELQAKLNVSKTNDLPALLQVAEHQQRECVAELARLRRPALAQAGRPDVEWRDTAVMLVDGFNTRWLQLLVDWLSEVCAAIEERIERDAT